MKPRKNPGIDDLPSYPVWVDNTFLAEIVTLAYKLKNCSQERFSSWLCDFLFSLTMEYFFGAQICEAKAL